ncbi:Hypothetical protein CINCED_3A020502 [Cinara cedri]|uniref:Uncharacterized protein n=1 Tax=Cinara cedri TaxID=506608 RepID=A0A5E4NTD5_9HEMI|nr:Hypothetical protein CINCED_3A020502 [Cinara cedri]
MDGKELCLNEHENLSSDQETNETINEYYVNKGFNDSNGSKEDLFNQVGTETIHSLTKMANSEIPTTTMQDGYVNDAYEDGFQKSNKGAVPLAQNTTIITSATLENQIMQLDEDNNGVVAINLEPKEKKWKVQSVGWDSNRSMILLGIVLAFDTWAAIFYCFKTNVITNSILN